ncbi:MAG: tannase/feruloyl esterase family alpha/beta hydrolase [Clostridia bacterium]|nr:tannase/feruloyl esterase family alpha/beta hydrolase [Clostridia bacterium]
MPKDITRIINKIKTLFSEITEVERIENGCFKNETETFSDLPSLCRVVIVSKPGKGSLINSELWLPDNWNGVFIGCGNGGMAGAIRYEKLTYYSKLGYAVANTDMGTSGDRNRGIDNPDVWKDFGWRATHIMTEISKAIIKEYYGKKESYSYFVGESTGGQQAYSEAQRFPDDYNGIIAGVPANNRVFLHTYFLWNHNLLRTKDGKTMFSSEKITQITDVANEYFSLKDSSEKKDYVSFPYVDKSTIDDFLGFLKEKCPEFTKEQLTSLEMVYKGPVNPETNEQIYNGMPIGSEVYTCGIEMCQKEESPFFYPFIWAFGEDYDGYEFDFSADLDRLHRKLSPYLNANNPDLSDFYRRGGKLMAYSGSADPCVPYPDAIKYYNRVCEKMGGYEIVKSFFKFYILPGKEHSTKGRGVNEIWANESGDLLLDALRQWCENEIEPSCIIGAHVDEESDEARVTSIQKVYPYESEKTEETDYPKSCDVRYLD